MQRFWNRLTSCDSRDSVSDSLSNTGNCTTQPLIRNETCHVGSDAL
jgi:hypothetical protein